MRLIRKVKFHEISGISQYTEIEKAFRNIKESQSDEHQLKIINELSDLHFYYIIEYVNIVSETLNCNEIFTSSSGKTTIVHYDKLLQEQKKIEKYLAEKQHKGPEYFKKLGVTNDVTGCYIIATTKKNTKSIHKLKLRKNNSIISLSLEFDSLPKTFERMCNDYSKKKDNGFEKDLTDFNSFMNLTAEEQDEIINCILHSVQAPLMPSEMFDIENIEEEFRNKYPRANEIATGTTIQNAAENNINHITNMEFLRVMLNSALETEDYELCAKVRDRINTLRYLS